MLFVFSFEAQFPEVGVGDGSAQLVVILATIERLLDVAAKQWGINIVKEIETADDMVILSQGASSFVFAGIGTELAHDNALGRRF